MKFTPQSPPVLLCLFFSITFFFSCSKDSDLMADYVALDPEIGTIAKFVANDTYQISIIPNPEDDTFEITVNSGSGGVENSGSGGTTVNDTYQTSSSASIVLDVLANDTFKNLEDVSISEISQPANGDVLINSDNTLTYTPFTVEATEDTFTYTAEFVKEDGTVGKETGTVTVTINEDPNKSLQSGDMGELKAFPGAEGFGKNATGGRGGKVIHVTNLNNSGSGSLRAAIDQTGARTIVFDVGGEIQLLSNLQIDTTEENVTIAGETAPSPGISMRNYSLNVRAANVIIRYITIRLGNYAGPSPERDGIQIRNYSNSGYVMEDIIVDHCSISWCTDENVSVDGNSVAEPVKDVSIQNCLIGEPSRGSSYNFLLGNYCYNISLYRNMITHARDRSIMASYGIFDENIEMINNVIYGFHGGATLTWGGNYDILGNVYKSFSDHEPYEYKINYGANSTNNPDASESDGSIHVANNYYDGIGDQTVERGTIAGYDQGSRIVKTSLISTWETTQQAIYDSVATSTVGNSLYRDAVDTRLMDDYTNRTGGFFEGIDPTTLPGGWPIKNSTNRPDDYDTDNDGMADNWEIAFFGNLSKTASGDEDGDGYTNLETFLYTLVQ